MIRYIGVIEALHCNKQRSHLAMALQCDCDKCKKVAGNLAKGVWLHDGMGNLRGDDHKIVGTELKADEIFNEPELDPEASASTKPSGAIWFSAGSWLFDPYCDNQCHDESPPTKNVVFKIKEPKNVLEIRTFGELKKFHDKYSVGDYIQSVNWEKVKNDGYYGVAFFFRKIIHLPDCPCNHQYDDMKWHYGFDVETLCIWDLRALDKVEIVEVEF